MVARDAVTTLLVTGVAESGSIFGVFAACDEDELVRVDSPLAEVVVAVDC